MVKQKLMTSHICPALSPPPKTFVLYETVWPAKFSYSSGANQEACFWICLEAWQGYSIYFQITWLHNHREIMKQPHLLWRFLIPCFVYLSHILSGRMRRGPPVVPSFPIPGQTLFLFFLSYWLNYPFKLSFYNYINKRPKKKTIEMDRFINKNFGLTQPVIFNWDLKCESLFDYDIWELSSPLVTFLDFLPCGFVNACVLVSFF